LVYPEQSRRFSTVYAVWLTSMYGSPQTTLPLALLWNVTSMYSGLTPYGRSCKRTIFTIQGTHKGYKQLGRMRLIENKWINQRSVLNWKVRAKNPQLLIAETV